MKPLFFFLFVFFSFTATAQFPKPGHNGYKKRILHEENDPADIYLEIKNNRNRFMEWFESYFVANVDGGMDKAQAIGGLFLGHKFFYNGQYYYSNYKKNNKPYYRVFVYPEAMLLEVSSVYNDSEFHQCQKMLNKQAVIIHNDPHFNYTIQ